jgi:hypothetical protein
VVDEEGEEGGEGQAASAGAAGGGTTRRSDLAKSRTRASSASQLTGGREFSGGIAGGESIAGVA